MFERRLANLACGSLLVASLLPFCALANAPEKSWEAWILALRRGSTPPPPRPDMKNISLPLPLWVDCHLGWASDRPKSKTRVTLSGEIVLVGTPKLCQGQLEEWAVE